MKRIPSHYDNLKVAPDASDEVIRAAYRALSQKHHPDRNPDNPDAHRIMSILNQSYAVLSDPQQRRAHDAWIADQRRLAAEAAAGRQPVAVWQPQSAPPVLPPPKTRSPASAWLQWLGMLVLVLAVVGAWYGWQHYRPQAEPVAAAPDFVAAPGLAPNGRPLPASKGYVPGYPQLRQQGHNVVRVDNSDLNSGVFAQLYELHQGKLTAIRSFYIPAGESFHVENIGDGDFSLHYQRLDTGQWQISDPWLIQNTQRSRQYRQIDVRL